MRTGSGRSGGEVREGQAGNAFGESGDAREAGESALRLRRDGLSASGRERHVFPGGFGDYFRRSDSRALRVSCFFWNIS